MDAEWPTYGYRRVTRQLQRQGWGINKKRVLRLMREMGLLARARRKARTTTQGEHDFPRYPNLVQGLEIVRPDQVWVSDITYILSWPENAIRSGISWSVRKIQKGYSS